MYEMLIEFFIARRGRLPVVARRMEESDPNLLPLDIAGVAFFDADGESNMPKFEKFFKTLRLRTLAF